MNGQMYQVCRIVAAAKSALVKQTSLDFTHIPYESKIEFEFLSQENPPEGRPTKVQGVSDWFACCTKKGLQDVKLLVPVSVEDRGLLGFSNTTKSTIVCFYAEQVTYFIAHWTFDPEKEAWNVLYTEHEWKDAPPGKPRFEDESANFGVVLSKIKDFACRIDCYEFAETFQQAIDILENGSRNIDEEYGLPLPSIPERNLHIFEAASAADVFGAMGSWNDSPPYMATEKNLYDEYDELSDELLKQLRLAILYAINEW